MNDFSAESMRASTRNHGRALAAALVLLTAAAGLSGCADLRHASFLPPVNPESPVAAQVAVGARRNFMTPAFSNVPPAPKNMPTAPAVKTAVFTMVGCRRSFEHWTRVNPAMVDDTAGFAAQEQAKVDTNPADVPTKAQDEASQAYAEKMKAYASPPAALPSGPALSASDFAPPPPKAGTPAPAKPAPTPTKPVAATPAPVAAAKPRPPRPAKMAAARKPTPPAATPASASTSPTVASVTVQAPGLALAPPPAAAAGDPLLQHCQ